VITSGYIISEGDAISLYRDTVQSMSFDSTTDSIWIASPTLGVKGIQFQYNDGSPQAYIGDGESNYFRIRDNDGYKISWSSSNTRLNEDGSFFCDSAEIGG